jgi:CheY-like chemotaxis protein
MTGKTANPGKVLVIDDAARDRDLVAAILQTAGSEVQQAESGVHGLQAVNTPPPPDVVLLDVQMPGMDGFEVRRLLRSSPATRGIPVLMITASDDAALNRNVYAVGAQACVPKPLRKDSLLAAIRAVWDAARRGKPPAGP